VYLLNGQDGGWSGVWPLATSRPFHLTGAKGGPPTIADFDGDGHPEVGVATTNRYTVIDDGGTLLWQRQIDDSSSGVTCASAHDFDWNGRSEIVYADENELYIFNGLTGATLWSAHRSSGTTYEMPAIADIDNDNHAEIVVGANDYDHVVKQYGIYAYGNDNYWLPCRPIWNQHTYHITNIYDDAHLEPVEVNNWQIPGYNSYRHQPIGFLVPVGGVTVRADALTLLTPYIGLASTIMVVTTATAIYIKRVKRREKQ